MVSVAVFSPAVAGAKRTVKVVVAPGAKGLEGWVRMLKSLLPLSATRLGVLVSVSVLPMLRTVKTRSVLRPGRMPTVRVPPLAMTLPAGCSTLILGRPTPVKIWARLSPTM